VYSPHWFKSKILAYISNENTESDKDTIDTDSDYRRNYYASLLRFPSGYSTHSGNGSAIYSNSPSHNSHSNGYDIFSRDIEFFIDAKRQHYDVLNRYIFRKLLVLHPSTRQSEKDVLPTYENNLPLNNYRYKDALLHMKEDKGDLHLDIEKYQQSLSNANKTICKENSDIKRIIDDELQKAGYDKNNINHADEIKSIENWINHHLKQALKSDDIYDYTDKLNVRLGANGISENAVNLIKTICTNHEILESLTSCRLKEEQLTSLSKTISDKSASIVTAIDAKDYDIDADCCPTYLSLIKRLI
jgi:hypothetical protein